jgi:acetamidase/formamidase
VPLPAESHLDPPGIRRVIDNSFPPVLTVESGTVVAFECPSMPLPRNATADDLDAFDAERPHTIVGPVAVAGAEPGDVLAIEVMAVELIAGYGHAAIVPGFGLLGDEVEAPYVHNFEWEPGADSTELRPGVRVPLNPFCGILGVMPAANGEHPTTPPRPIGGNLDIRHLVPGSTLFLPVEVPGALFFAGDGHGAQGDGEVGISGLETPARGTFRLSVNSTRSIRGPQFTTPVPLDVDSAAGYYATSGVGPDLYACSQEAVRQMVEYLVAEHGLPWQEAYILCSLVVDLKINEAVDIPNWVVSAYLPLSVFTKG